MLVFVHCYLKFNFDWVNYIYFIISFVKAFHYSILLTFYKSFLIFNKGGFVLSRVSALGVGGPGIESRLNPYSDLLSISFISETLHINNEREDWDIPF